MPVAQALFEAVVQLLGAEALFAFFEVAAHHLLVDFDYLIEDALVGVGDRGKIRLAVGPEEAVHDRLAAFGR